MSRCAGNTLAGPQCRAYTTNANGYCSLHQGQFAVGDGPPVGDVPPDGWDSATIATWTWTLLHRVRINPIASVLTMVVVGVLMQHYSVRPQPTSGNPQPMRDNPRHPCDTYKTMFNRHAEARTLKALIQETPILTINGPLKSGKSSLVSTVLRELSDTVLCFDVYDRRRSSYESLNRWFDIDALRFVRWVEERSDPSILAFISERLGVGPAAAAPHYEMTKALLDKKGPRDFIQRLEAAIEAHYENTGNLTYIFIHNAGPLNFQLWPSLFAHEKDDGIEFAHELERMFIRVTKERNMARVVQTTGAAIVGDQVLSLVLDTRDVDGSDLHPLAVETKGYSKFATLGYMAKEQVLLYLAKHEKIDDAALCEEIYEQVGGEFRLLEAAGHRFRDGGAGKVREGIITIDLRSHKAEYSRVVHRLKNDDRKMFARLSATLVKETQQPLLATQQLYGRDFVERILQARLLQVRPKGSSELQLDLEETPEEDVLMFPSPLYHAAVRALGSLDGGDDTFSEAKTELVVDNRSQSDSFV